MNIGPPKEKITTEEIRYAVRLGDGFAVGGEWRNGPVEFRFAKLYHAQGVAQRRANMLNRRTKNVHNALPYPVASVVTVRILLEEWK